MTQPQRGANRMLHWQKMLSPGDLALSRFAASRMGLGMEALHRVVEYSIGVAQHRETWGLSNLEPIGLETCADRARLCLSSDAADFVDDVKRLRESSRLTSR